MRIAAICRGSFVFLEPLLKHWKNRGYDIVNTLNEADAIFVEWANEQSIAVTNSVKHKNVVIRLHGSEYFQNYHDRWDKEKVHAVIKANPTYTIKGVKEIQCGIPIDIDFWHSLTEIDRGDRRLIMVGSFVYSKNHVGLLNILSERPDYFDEVIFIGDIDASDNPYRYAETQKTLKQISYYVNKYKLPVNIVNKKSPEQLRMLYSHSNYIVSNSINEGFHITICEGILCGCKPLIYDWAGANEIYGIKTYNNAKTFWKMIDDYPYKTQSYLKSIIINKYDKNKVFEIIDNTLFDAAREWM